MWGWDAPVLPSTQTPWLTCWSPESPLSPQGSALALFGDGHLLPATTRAMGREFRGYVRTESPDPVAGWQEGTPEERPLAEELWGLAVAHRAAGKAGNSHGFWRLGTLCPHAGAGSSSFSAGVFLAGGKPRAWGGCRQRCPACSPSCCPGRADAAPEPLHGPSRYW